jgi:hypothetical protein
MDMDALHRDADLDKSGAVEGIRWCSLLQWFPVFAREINLNVGAPSIRIARRKSSESCARRRVFRRIHANARALLAEPAVNRPPETKSIRCGAERAAAPPVINGIAPVCCRSDAGIYFTSAYEEHIRCKS